jgi:hypothetical protein
MAAPTWLADTSLTKEISAPSGGWTRTAKDERASLAAVKASLEDEDDIIKGSVSDYVTDVVMSSLKTCNMNCGKPLGGGREGREQGVGS